MLTAAAADEWQGACPAQPLRSDTPHTHVLPLLRERSKVILPGAPASANRLGDGRLTHRVTRASELKTTPRCGWVFQLRIIW